MKHLNDLIEIENIVREEKKRFYSNNFYRFDKEVLGYELFTDKPHKELCDFIQNNTEDKFKLLLMPRGSFKSSAVTIGYPLWKIAQDPNIRILIDSETFDQSKAFLSAIKQHMESNQIFRDVFGVLDKQKGGDTWARTAITVPRDKNLKEPTVDVAGIGNTKVGMHYDIIICDDLHSEKNITSKEMIEGVINHYKLLFSLLEPGGEMIVIGCLTKDSMVLMSDGTWKRIVDVKVGDKVWSIDKNGNRVEKVVEAMIPQGVSKVLEVKTKRNVIKATPNHPFMVLENKQYVWKKAEELKENDQIVSIKGIKSGYKKRYDKNNFADNDFCYLFGFLMGDGWVGKDKDRGYLSFSAGVDDKLNNKVSDLIEKIFNKRPYLTKNKTYRVDNINAQRIMDKMGLNGGAHNKRIPEWVFKSRPSGKRAFLKGLIDADGTKNATGYGFRVELCNEELIEDIKYLSLTCGVRPTSIYHRQRLIKAPNSKEETLRDFWSIGLTFENNNAVPEAKTLTNKRGLRFDRVLSITQKDEEEVYDLTVKDTHNFIAEGMVVHNTRWDFSDLYQHIIDNESDRFKVFIRKAIEDDGTLLMPERLTREFLDNIRKTQGSYHFSGQYLNNPVSDEAAVFKKEDFKHYKPEDIDIPLNIFMSVDPAISVEQTADYSAIVVGGFDNNGNIYILDIFRGRVESKDLINQIFQMAEKWKPRMIGIEVTAFQQVLVYNLNDEMRARGIYLPVTGLKRDNSESKEMRIRGLQPKYQSHNIYHPQRHAYLFDLEFELLRFPRGKTDDIIDAEADLLQIAYPRKNRKYKKYHKLPPRSNITGV